MKHLLCAMALMVTLAAGAQTTPHPLTAAIDLHSNLALVADLQPNSRQLLDMLAASRASRQLAAQYDNDLEQAMQARADVFKQQAQCLAAGTPVPDNVNASVAEYFTLRNEGRLKLRQAVDTQVRKVRRALAPDQTRLIDWSRPAELSTESDDEAVLSEMRDLMADLNGTIRALERVRYLIPGDYVTTRVGHLTDFLVEYYRPNTPQFKDALNWMMKLTDEARVVSEKDWPGQAPLFAARVLQRVGALGVEQEQAQARAPYNWWDVYYLLTDPHTPELLQQMLAARGAPVQ